MGLPCPLSRRWGKWRSSGATMDPWETNFLFRPCRRSVGIVVRPARRLNTLFSPSTHPRPSLSAVSCPGHGPLRSEGGVCGGQELQESHGSSVTPSEPTTHC